MPGGYVLILTPLKNASQVLKTYFSALSNLSYPNGLIFPPFLYGRRNGLIRNDNFFPSSAGEIETEGLGVMASDMGYECWGMPNLEILHYPA